MFDSSSVKHIRWSVTWHSGTTWNVIILHCKRIYTLGIYTMACGHNCGYNLSVLFIAQAFYGTCSKSEWCHQIWIPNSLNCDLLFYSIEFSVAPSNIVLQFAVSFTQQFMHILNHDGSTDSNFPKLWPVILLWSSYNRASAIYTVSFTHHNSTCSKSNGNTNQDTLLHPVGTWPCDQCFLHFLVWRLLPTVSTVCTHTRLKQNQTRTKSYKEQQQMHAHGVWALWALVLP